MPMTATTVSAVTATDGSDKATALIKAVAIPSATLPATPLRYIASTPVNRIEVQLLVTFAQQ